MNQLYKCEKCGKITEVKFASGRFCSRSCANSHAASDVQRLKASKTMKAYNLMHPPIISKHNMHKHKEAVIKYNENPKHCCICDGIIAYNLRYRKTCCDKCFKESLSSSGLKSVTSQSSIRRSKNEVYFYTICKNYFKNVQHNKPIFNGWDADVIIEDIKYAILWNGPWHYRKIKYGQSIEQIQNRDKIKIKEIVDCGYTPYIIKDLGKYNKKFVESEFAKFKEHLNCK